MSTNNKIKEAANLIANSKRTVAFTGAGISVESGIPPFRGKNGLWSRYDPEILDINYFRQNPLISWKVIKEIFYDFFGQAQPNAAHKALVKMEQKNLLQSIITQNIDNLHQEAGSKNVYEFHGNSRRLVCTNCGEIFIASEEKLGDLPPTCKFCSEVLKPDFIFFGEAIPEPANSKSFREAEISDLFILIGTTGEIMPASLIPRVAKEKGATIIEINTEKSKYTNSITDIFIQEKATVALTKIVEQLSL
ncbi:NAD-dependent protein deacetylase [bacterium BMS3Abin04]|nr:NAD-dependent protein deacetylase [bacterium BMS3Abin04]